MLTVFSNSNTDADSATQQSSYGERFLANYIMLPYWDMLKPVDMISMMLCVVPCVSFCGNEMSCCLYIRRLYLLYPLFLLKSTIPHLRQPSDYPGSLFSLASSTRSYSSNLRVRCSTVPNSSKCNSHPFHPLRSPSCASSPYHPPSASPLSPTFPTSRTAAEFISTPSPTARVTAQAR